MTSSIYTARTLARRWQCTPQHVYNLRQRGDLTGFKLGKLWRITAQEIEAFEGERCPTTGSEGSTADGLSCGRKVGGDIDGALSQRMRLRRAQHSETLPENVTRLRGQPGE
jgi:hypothetical protein